MNTDWINSNYIVILYYRPYSCGKFLSNVLSFNKNFCPQFCLQRKYTGYENGFHRLYDPKVEELLSNSEIDEKIFTEYKIEKIFKTIPKSKSECDEWTSTYELGCFQFWGTGIFGDLLKEPIKNIYPQPINVLNQKKYSFIVSHDIDQLKRYRLFFKNAKIIEIVNDEKINFISRQLKNSNIAVPQPINESCELSLKFDINSIFDERLFFQHITDLLQQFNINDVELDSRVYKFYNMYINLHK